MVYCPQWQLHSLPLPSLCFFSLLFLLPCLPSAMLPFLCRTKLFESFHMARKPKFYPNLLMMMPAFILHVHKNFTKTLICFHLEYVFDKWTYIGILTLFVSVLCSCSELDDRLSSSILSYCCLKLLTITLDLVFF